MTSNADLMTADPNALSPQQEAFAAAYARLGNGAESHRLAYNGKYGEKSRRGASAKRSEQARVLLSKPKIAARIAELIEHSIAELSAQPGSSEVMAQLTKRRDRVLDRASSARSKMQEPASGALGADQLADLVRIAARDDLPASVRHQAGEIVQSHLAKLQQTLAARLGI